MHDPNRLTLPRPRGGYAHYVVCGECAQLGKGSTVTADTGVYAGVIYGPLSAELLADSLVAAHRTQSERHASGTSAR